MTNSAACVSLIQKKHTTWSAKFIFSRLYKGSDHSHMGRSILAVLLATILAISRVSNNPTPSACQSLFIIFAPRRLPSCREQGGGGGGTLSQQGLH